VPGVEVAYQQDLERKQRHLAGLERIGVFDFGVVGGNGHSYLIPGRIGQSGVVFHDRKETSCENTASRDVISELADFKASAPKFHC